MDDALLERRIGTRRRGPECPCEAHVALVLVDPADTNPNEGIPGESRGMREVAGEKGGQVRLDDVARAGVVRGLPDGPRAAGEPGLDSPGTVDAR